MKFTDLDDFLGHGTKTAKSGANPLDILEMGGRLIQGGKNFIKSHPIIAGSLGLGVGAGAATGLFGALSGEVPSKTIGYRINRGMHGLMDRIQADEAAGEAFAKSLGSSSAESLMGLTKDVLSKGYDSLKDTLMLSPTRKTIFNTLKKEDPILADTENKVLLEAYHTMSRFAPTLSTDKNAVKSFLREAATSGGGVNHNTIKLLADAEGTINKNKPGGIL